MDDYDENSPNIDFDEELESDEGEEGEEGDPYNEKKRPGV
jgi:hypothetical protein